MHIRNSTFITLTLTIVHLSFIFAELVLAIPILGIEILYELALFALSFHLQKLFDSFSELFCHNFGRIVLHIVIGGDIVVEIRSDDRSTDFCPYLCIFVQETQLEVIVKWELKHDLRDPNSICVPLINKIIDSFLHLSLSIIDEITLYVLIRFQTLNT